MTVFGGFGGRYDPEMGSKIDQLLAGKKSRADKVNEFLEKDLGINPNSLPLSTSDAKAATITYFTQHALRTMEFVGNSVFGLVAVNTTPEDDENQITCPSCGLSQGGDWIDTIARTWECAECDVVSTIAMLDVATEITESRDNADQWHEFSRWYAALSKVHGRRFRMERDDRDWQDRYKLVPFLEEAVDTDPNGYATGDTLLIVRGSEQEVVRVGTLFGDSGFTILRTMKPMDDITGWSVKEVL